LTDIAADESNYARDSDLFSFTLQPGIDHVVPHSPGENIVVEFR